MLLLFMRVVISGIHQTKIGSIKHSRVEAPTDFTIGSTAEAQV